jgi:hypothetical protein|tara:strand:+ start:561 stop:884 length:324 start_codon:yes stop_codon:yes gene_type:complete
MFIRYHFHTGEERSFEEEPNPVEWKKLEHAIPWDAAREFPEEEALVANSANSANLDLRSIPETIVGLPSKELVDRMRVYSKEWLNRRDRRRSNEKQKCSHQTKAKGE